MSLIVTHISSHGIIHATDSNVTSCGLPAGEARKVFKLPFLDAGLTVAGSYSVGGERMDDWLTKFVQVQQQANCASLKQFATTLSQALEQQMTQKEKAGGSMIHIAGYVPDADGSHPEFWFVRNIYSMDRRTGEYGDFKDTFQVTEDLWNRDWQCYKLGDLFRRGGYQLYTNGYTSGRISYWILQDYMAAFFAQIWQNPAWRFRPPTSLEESRLLVDLYIRAVGVLFRISDYSAPFIGGSPQTYAIAEPKGRAGTGT
jgi:hypothetical protein